MVCDRRHVSALASAAASWLRRVAEQGHSGTPLNPGDGFTKANFLRELEFLTLVSTRDSELLRPIIADDRTSEVIVQKGRILTLASWSSPRQPTCC
jgi:hypothetical protein